MESSADRRRRAGPPRSGRLSARAGEPVERAQRLGPRSRPRIVSSTAELIDPADARSAVRAADAPQQAPNVPPGRDGSRERPTCRSGQASDRSIMPRSEGACGSRRSLSAPWPDRATVNTSTPRVGRAHGGRSWRARRSGSSRCQMTVLEIAHVVLERQLDLVVVAAEEAPRPAARVRSSFWLPSSRKPIANTSRTGRCLDASSHERHHEAGVEPAGEHRAERHVAHQPDRGQPLPAARELVRVLVDVRAGSSGSGIGYPQ